MRRELVSPARRERSLQRELAGAPEAAHAALRIEYEAAADALGPGTRAAVQELALTKRPWPFPLSEVNTPVHLWHGALDRHAPIAFARRQARELPNATLHVSDSSGHDVGADRSGEIMSVLASHLKQPGASEEKRPLPHHPDPSQPAYHHRRRPSPPTNRAEHPAASTADRRRTHDLRLYDRPLAVDGLKMRLKPPWPSP